MSIPYLNIARAIALRTGQLGDAESAAAFEAVYASALSSAVSGMEIPLSELKRLVLASEKKLASICARQKNPILKAGLAAHTANLASGASLPIVDSNAKEFIGGFDGFFDATDLTPLTEKPKEVIARNLRRIMSNELSMQVYQFCLEGRVLIHTRTNVYANGYSWDYTTQATAYGASGNSPLAQECEIWWIADALANAAQEGWFSQEAGLYAGIAGGCEQDVRQGAIPQAVLPDSTASAEPVKN